MNIEGPGKNKVVAYSVAIANQTKGAGECNPFPLQKMPYHAPDPKGMAGGSQLTKLECVTLKRKIQKTTILRQKKDVAVALHGLWEEEIEQHGGEIRSPHQPGLPLVRSARVVGGGRGLKTKLLKTKRNLR